MKTRLRFCCWRAVMSWSYMDRKFWGVLLGTKWRDTSPARPGLSSENCSNSGVWLGDRDTNSCDGENTASILVTKVTHRASL